MELGLLGWPLSHSRSPKIHQTAFMITGEKGNYSLFPTENKEHLKAEIAKVRSGEITGFNVTIPYKEEVIQYLDGLTSTAKMIGAVNTIYLKDGVLMGDNTDAPGFVSDLKNHGFDLDDKPGEALVFGAGGSARAVIFSLLNYGWQINLLVRHVDKAKDTVKDLLGKGLTGGIKVRPIDELQSLIRRIKVDLIVNTTPLGMSPNISGSPWPQDLELPSGAFVYDLVYNPSKTTLLSQAESAGLKFANGSGMLVEQALLSFERWTGNKVDRGFFAQKFSLEN